MVENDCEEQGYTLLSEGCYACQYWEPGALTPTRPALVPRDGWWTCIKCKGAYGAVETAAVSVRPLNGQKTGTLTPAAVAALKDLWSSPIPRQELNPGLANRLLREALVESVQLPSPYKTHKGKSIEHFKLTEAGKLRVKS